MPGARRSPNVVCFFTTYGCARALVSGVKAEVLGYMLEGFGSSGKARQHWEGKAALGIDGAVVLLVSESTRKGAVACALRAVYNLKRADQYVCGVAARVGNMGLIWWVEARRQTVALMKLLNLPK